MPRHTPTKLKILAGNPGGRALPEHEVDPPVGNPEPPLFLDDMARAEWDRIYRLLFNVGLVTEIDVAALAAYCVAYGRWAHFETRLRKDMTKRPATWHQVRTVNKNWIPNPLIGAANVAMRDMMKAAGEFGMTPNARRGLEIRMAEQDREKRPYNKQPKPGDGWNSFPKSA